MVDFNIEVFNVDKYLSIIIFPPSADKRMLEGRLSLQHFTIICKNNTITDM